MNVLMPLPCDADPVDGCVIVVVVLVRVQGPSSGSWPVVVSVTVCKTSPDDGDAAAAGAEAFAGGDLERDLSFRRLEVAHFGGIACQTYHGSAFWQLTGFCLGSSVDRPAATKSRNGS